MLSSNKDEVRVLIERLSTKELLAKSLKELTQTKPIDKITIKDIADNCSLSKRTFYHNFQDKIELVKQNNLLFNSLPRRVFEY